MFKPKQIDEQERLDSSDVTLAERKFILSELDRMNERLGIYKKFLKEFHRHIITHLPSSRPVRILEVGGGSGGLAAKVLAEMARANIPAEYHIFDIHDDILQWAKDNVRAQGFDISTHNGGDQYLKIFAERSYDIVISLHVLHHIQPAEILQEMLRDIMRVTNKEFFMVDFDRRYGTVPMMLLLKFLIGINNVLYSDGVKSARRAYTAAEMRIALDNANVGDFTCTSDPLYMAALSKNSWLAQSIIYLIRFT